MSMACTQCLYVFTDVCSSCVDDSEFEDRLEFKGYEDILNQQDDTLQEVEK